MIRRTFLLAFLLGASFAAHAEDIPILTPSVTTQAPVPSIGVSSPSVTPIDLSTPSVTPPSSATVVASPVAVAKPCESYTSPSDKWTILLATGGTRLELLRVGSSEIKTVFEWQQATCLAFYGWTPDEKYFYFRMGSPLNRAYVLAEQREIYAVNQDDAEKISPNPVLISPGLYPFSPADEWAFADNRYIWIEKGGTKIKRTDLVLGRTDIISEGKHFSLSPDGSNLVIDRISELTFKDLVNGAEVILDPLEKVNRAPSADWNKSGGYVIGGWKAGGSRFWYHKTFGDNQGWTVLINRAQIVLTNVDPQENAERIFNLEDGWLVETVLVKAGETGMFQTVKPEESVLTIMGMVSGNITEVARSLEKSFSPKFVTENEQIFLEYTVAGEINRMPASELKNKVESAFLKKSTFVKSSVLKNLRK